MHSVKGSHAQSVFKYRAYRPDNCIRFFFFFYEQIVEIKQKQLLFVRISGENLQINLRVFSVSFQLGLSARLRPFMSLSQRPLWVCLCVHITFIFCLHSAVISRCLQTSHSIYNKQEESAWYLIILSAACWHVNISDTFSQKKQVRSASRGMFLESVERSLL